MSVQLPEGVEPGVYPVYATFAGSYASTDVRLSVAAVQFLGAVNTDRTKSGVVSADLNALVPAAAGLSGEASWTMPLAKTGPTSPKFLLSASGRQLSVKLLGEYFSGQSFSQLLMTREDSQINFNWEGGSPEPRVPSDNFCVRWTGLLTPQYSESYQFQTENDDEVKVWLNGNVIINNGGWSNPVPLVAGKTYPLSFEYHERGGGAYCKFYWQSASQSRQIIPTSGFAPLSAVELTQSGTIGISNFTPWEATVLVQGTDASNRTVLGALELQSIFVDGSASLSVVAGQAGGAQFDLNALPGMPLLSPSQVLSSNGSNAFSLDIDLGQDWTFEAEYLMNSSNDLNTVFSYGSYSDGILLRTLRGDSVYVKNQGYGTIDIFGGASTLGKFVPVKISFANGSLSVYAGGSLIRSFQGLGTLSPATKRILLGSAVGIESQGFDGRVRNIKIIKSGETPLAYLSGDSALRNWSFSGNSAVPSWASLTQGGLLSLTPGAADQSATVLVQQSYGSEMSLVAMDFGVVNFQAALAVDASSGLTSDLNGLAGLSGDAATRKWSVDFGNSDALNGITLTEAGVLRVPIGAIASGQSRGLMLEVVSGGQRSKGKVTLNALTPVIAPPLLVISGQGASTLNLADLNYGSGFNVTGPLPVGVTLSNGTLTVADSGTAATGVRAVYLQKIEGGVATLLKLPVVGVNKRVAQFGEPLRNGGLRLDLGALLAPGSLVYAPTWSLAPGQTGLESGIFVEAGSLIVSGSQLLTQGPRRQLRAVVQAESAEATQPPFYAAIDLDLVNPTLGGETLEVYVGNPGVRVVDLNQWAAGAAGIPSGASTEWRLTAGQSVLLSGVSLSSTGTMQVLIPGSVSAGLREIYLDRLTTQGSGSSAVQTLEIARLSLDVKTIATPAIYGLGAVAGGSSGTTLNLAAELDLPQDFVGPVVWASTDLPVWASLNGGQLTLSRDSSQSGVRASVLLSATDATGKVAFRRAELLVSAAPVVLPAEELRAIAGTIPAPQVDLNALLLKAGSLASNLTAPFVWSVAVDSPLPGWAQLSAGTLRIAAQQSEPSSVVDVLIHGRDAFESFISVPVTLRLDELTLSGAGSLRAIAGVNPPVELSVGSLVADKTFVIAGSWSLESVLPAWMGFDAAKGQLVAGGISTAGMPEEASRVVVSGTNSAGIRARITVDANLKAPVMLPAQELRATAGVFPGPQIDLSALVAASGSLISNLTAPIVWPMESNSHLPSWAQLSAGTLRIAAQQTEQESVVNVLIYGRDALDSYISVPVTLRLDRLILEGLGALRAAAGMNPPAQLSVGLLVADKTFVNAGSWSLESVLPAWMSFDAVKGQLVAGGISTAGMPEEASKVVVSGTNSAGIRARITVNANLKTPVMLPARELRATAGVFPGPQIDLNAVVAASGSLISNLTAPIVWPMESNSHLPSWAQLSAGTLRIAAQQTERESVANVLIYGRDASESFVSVPVTLRLDEFALPGAGALRAIAGMNPPIELSVGSLVADKAFVIAGSWNLESVLPAWMSFDAAKGQLFAGGISTAGVLGESSQVVVSGTNSAGIKARVTVNSKLLTNAGLFTVGTFSVGGTVGVVAGSGSVQFDLNVGLPESVRPIRWSLGVGVPNWVSCTESGLVTVAPGAAILPGRREFSLNGASGVDAAGMEVYAGVSVQVHPAAPEINKQMPPFTVAKVGEALALQPGVQAPVTKGLTYKWIRTLVEGGSQETVGNGATLPLVGNSASEGFYALEVSNETGSVTSEPTELLVPTLTISPRAISAAVGDSVRQLSATLSGRSAMKSVNFVWSKGETAGGSFAQGTASSVVSVGSVGLGKITADDGGQYVVTALISHADTPIASVSASATVLVNPIGLSPISVIWPAADQSGVFRSGGRYGLSVQVSGAGATPTYQWRLNGNSLGALATGSQYTISSMSATQTGVYDVVVTSGSFSSTSNARKVEILKAIDLDKDQFLRQSRTVMEGGSLQLSVQVKDGTPPYHFQWIRDGVVVKVGSVGDESPERLTVGWGELSQGGSYGVAGSYSVSVASVVNGTRDSLSEVNSGSVWIGELRKIVAGSFEIVSSVANKEVAAGSLSTALLPGSAVSLSVRAKAGASSAGVPASYQWRSKGTPLIDGAQFSGVKTRTLTVKSLSFDLAGEYEVLLRNDAGEVTLSQPVVFALDPVRKLGELAPLTVMAGDPVRWDGFGVEGGSLNYRWLRQGTLAVAGTSSVLTIGSAQPADAGTYTLMVSNTLSGGGTFSVESSSARLRVLSGIKFERITLRAGTSNAGTMQSGMQAVNGGERVEFSVEANGGTDGLSPVAGLRYQWLRGGLPISGGTGATYVIGAVGKEDVDVAYSVSLSVVDPVSKRVIREVDSGRLPGGAVRLSLRPPLEPPTVWRVLSGGTQSGAGTSVAGGSTSFVVLQGGATPASGMAYPAGVAYQWMYNGRVLSNGTLANVGLVSGATGSLLTVANLSALGSGSYAVRVTSESNRNDVQSAVGFGLQVLEPARIVQQPVAVKVAASAESQVRLRVVVEGTNSEAHPLTYRWMRNRVALTSSGTVSGAVIAASAGATRREILVDAPNKTSTLVIDGSEDTNEVDGLYSVEVSNGVGVPVTSSAATVTAVPTQLRFDPVVSGTVLAGSEVVFRVGVSKAVAGGVEKADGLTYQWRRNGRAITGASGRTDSEGKGLLKLVAGSASGGEYDALVTLGGQSFASPAAMLTVLEPVRITRDLTPMLAVLPETAQSGTASVVLSVDAVGSGSLKYDWYAHSLSTGFAEPLSTGTTSSSVVVVADDTRKWYSVNVWSDYTVSGGTPFVAGSLQAGTTSAMSVNVPVQLLEAVANPRVSVAPGGAVSVGSLVSTTVTAGGTLVLSGSATGGGTLSYQWRRNGRAIVGATSPALRVEELRLNDGGLYQLFASNPRNALVCGTVDVTVGEADVIVKQPELIQPALPRLGMGVSQGQDVVLRVVAEGRDLSYQWRRNGQPLSAGALIGEEVEGGIIFTVSGEKTSKLTLSKVMFGKNGSGAGGVYDVLVTHAFGSSVSSIYRLNVNEPINIESQSTDVRISEGAPATLTVKASGADLKYQWRRNG
jgi:hypothetical protein